MIVKKPRGGMWLDLKKYPAAERPIGELKAPLKIFLPVRQYKGVPPTICVSAGDRVLAGQPVAKETGGVSCSLHSPVSGTISAITTCDHPVSGRCQMVVIENDGRDTPYKIAKQVPLKGEAVLNAVKESAAVTADGYGSPLWIKLNNLSEKKVKTIVINAVEDEPYICTSQKLMDECPDQIAEGLGLLLECTGAKSAVLAVSDDIPSEIVDGMEESARLAGITLKIAHVPQKYPLSYEKYLMWQIFPHEIKNAPAHLRGAEPEELHIGFVRAEDCVTIKKAVKEGLPQTTCVITVAGDAVEDPQNLEVCIGTTVRDVLDHCGLAFDPDRVVLGSAMRGVAINDLKTPITKSVTAVLALKASHGGMKKSICINCGKCVNVCPEGLLPNYIAMRAVKAEFDALRELHISECSECGLCAYVCPGRMPIVELVKNIKKAAL